MWGGGEVGGVGGGACPPPRGWWWAIRGPRAPELPQGRGLRILESALRSCGKAWRGSHPGPALLVEALGLGPEEKGRW